MIAAIMLGLVTLNAAFAAGSIFTGGDRLAALIILFVAACCQGGALIIGAAQ